MITGFWYLKMRRCDAVSVWFMQTTSMRGAHNSHSYSFSIPAVICICNPLPPFFWHIMSSLHDTLTLLKDLLLSHKKNSLYSHEKECPACPKTLSLVLLHRIDICVSLLTMSKHTHDPLYPMKISLCKLEKIIFCHRIFWRCRHKYTHFLTAKDFSTLKLWL